MTDLVQRLRRYKLVSGYAWYCHRAADRIEQLERENAEIRKDAERYRWARNALADRSQKGVSHWFFCIENSAGLDAAIDAAMQKEQS